MKLHSCTIIGDGNILAIIFSHFTGIGTNSLTAVTSATTTPIPNTESQESDSAVTIAAVIVVLIIAAMLAAVIGLVVILVIFRRKAKRTGITDALCNDSLKELQNPVYSGKQA